MPGEGADGHPRSAGRRIAIAVALIVGLMLGGAIAAALLAHPSSSAASGGRPEAGATRTSGNACHDPFVAEAAPDASGHGSPLLAARRWAMTTEYYPDAPTTDQEHSGPSSARSGNWQTTAAKTKHRGWVVSRLTCP